MTVCDQRAASLTHPLLFLSSGWCHPNTGSLRPGPTTDLAFPKRTSCFSSIVQIRAGSCWLDKQDRMESASAPLTSWDSPALGAFIAESQSLKL